MSEGAFQTLEVDVPQMFALKWDLANFANWHASLHWPPAWRQRLTVSECKKDSGQSLKLEEENDYSATKCPAIANSTWKETRCFPVMDVQGRVRKSGSFRDDIRVGLYSSIPVHKDMRLHPRAPGGSIVWVETISVSRVQSQKEGFYTIGTFLIYLFLTTLRCGLLLGNCRLFYFPGQRASSQNTNVTNPKQTKD